MVLLWDGKIGAFLRQGWVWEKHGLTEGLKGRGSLEKRLSLKQVKFRKYIFYLAELTHSRNAGTWPLHNKFFADDVVTKSVQFQAYYHTASKIQMPCRKREFHGNVKQFLLWRRLDETNRWNVFCFHKGKGCLVPGGHIEMRFSLCYVSDTVMGR